MGKGRVLAGVTERSCSWWIGQLRVWFRMNQVKPAKIQWKSKTFVSSPACECCYTERKWATERVHVVRGGKEENSNKTPVQPYCILAGEYCKGGRATGTLHLLWGCNCVPSASDPLAGWLAGQRPLPGSAVAAATLKLKQPREWSFGSLLPPASYRNSERKLIGPTSILQKAHLPLKQPLQPAQVKQEFGGRL